MGTRSGATKRYLPPCPGCQCHGAGSCSHGTPSSVPRHGRESHVAHLALHGNPQTPQNPSALRETSATAPHSTSTSTPRRAHARRTRAGQSHAPGPCLAYRAHRLVEHRLRCCLHSAVTREHARGRAEAGGGDAPLQSRVALLSSARVPRRAAAPVPSRGVCGPECGVLVWRDLVAA